MRLGAMLGRAAALLSIAAVGAAVAVPAQAATPTRELQIDITVPLDSPVPFDGLMFEVFDSGGTQLIEFDPTTSASGIGFPGGGTCDTSATFHGVSWGYTVNCYDVPAGNYLVGGYGSDPALGFQAGCSTQSLIPEPALSGAEFSIADWQDVHCTLTTVYGGSSTSLLGSDLGFSLYDDTSLGLGDLAYRITNGTTLDITADSDSIALPGALTSCFMQTEDSFLAIVTCFGLPVGDYTVTGSRYPDGAVVGELTCVSTNAFDESPENAIATTNGFSVDGPAVQVVCLQYFGTGIPVFIDVDPSQVDIPLSDIVIELYDESGALVAEATDPSADACVPVELIDPEAPYDLVANPDACAVLMVAPPFPLPFLAETEDDSSFDWDATSYSVGLRGPDGALTASAASTTVSHKDLSSPGEPVGIAGSTATFAIDYEGGRIPTGATMSVTAETIVLADAPAAPQLPDTGPANPWAPAAAAGSAILVGAYLLMRRRAQI